MLISLFNDFVLNWNCSAHVAFLSLRPSFLLSPRTRQQSDSSQLPETPASKSPDPGPPSSSAHVPHSSAYAPPVLSALVLAAVLHPYPYAAEDGGLAAHLPAVHTVVRDGSQVVVRRMTAGLERCTVDSDSGRSHRASLARRRRSIAGLTSFAV